MRIRKNAKNISALLYTNTNVSNINVSDESFQQKNYNFCELNQSPWDIITFPSSNSSPSFHQFNNYEVDYNVNVSGHRSSIGSVGYTESVASKTLIVGENDAVSIRKKDCVKTLGFKEKESIKVQEDIKLCGETDEKGWQCGNVVTKRNTMCDYHISELQNYGVWTIKKKSRDGPGPKTGARPHRPKKQPTTNPHEFYYYSGFGPSWGKKRGAVGTVSSDNDSDTSIQGKKGKRFEARVSEIEPMELDLVDDDDDDNDDKKGNLVTYGKKRMRKPVKERSLKSLM
ncbi:uncharacterized protein [Rutidosis leptorrhynchoides]|uniref:uncharacterized protein n=1 Tax=Rutidosis leptorrhynchoides TaxID=125765 RepID=UPI003A9924CD